MAGRQARGHALDEVAQVLADLTARVERLERLAADRTEPVVAAAAVVVDDALCALARSANLDGDGGPPWTR